MSNACWIEFFYTFCRLFSLFLFHLSVWAPFSFIGINWKSRVSSVSWMLTHWEWDERWERERTLIEKRCSLFVCAEMRLSLCFYFIVNFHLSVPSEHSWHTERVSVCSAINLIHVASIFATQLRFCLPAHRTATAALTPTTLATLTLDYANKKVIKNISPTQTGI